MEEIHSFRTTTPVLTTPLIYQMETLPELTLVNLSTTFSDSALKLKNMDCTDERGIPSNSITKLEEDRWEPDTASTEVSINSSDHTDSSLITEEMFDLAYTSSEESNYIINHNDITHHHDPPVEPEAAFVMEEKCVPLEDMNIQCWDAENSPLNINSEPQQLKNEINIETKSIADSQSKSHTNLNGQFNDTQLRDDMSAELEVGLSNGDLLWEDVSLGNGQLADDLRMELDNTPSNCKLLVEVNAVTYIKEEKGLPSNNMQVENNPVSINNENKQLTNDIIIENNGIIDNTDANLDVHFIKNMNMELDNLPSNSDQLRDMSPLVDQNIDDISYNSDQQSIDKNVLPSAVVNDDITVESEDASWSGKDHHAVSTDVPLVSVPTVELEVILCNGGHVKVEEKSYPEVDEVNIDVSCNKVCATADSQLIKNVQIKLEDPVIVDSQSTLMCTTNPLVFNTGITTTTVQKHKLPISSFKRSFSPKIHLVRTSASPSPVKASKSKVTEDLAVFSSTGSPRVAKKRRREWRNEAAEKERKLSNKGVGDVITGSTNKHRRLIRPCSNIATRKSTRLRFPTKINNIEQVNESKHKRLSRDFSCVASKKSFVKTEIVESISCSPKVSASLSNDKIMSSSLFPTSSSIVTFVGGAGSGGSFNTKQDKPSPRRQSLRSNSSKNYNITEIIRHKCIRSLEFSTPSSSDTQSKQVNKKTSAQDNSQGTSASGSTNQGEGHDESFGGSSQSSDGSKKGRTPKRRRSSRKSEDGTLPFQKDWVCVLCGLGNNERNLGYLFGPYELSEGTKNEEKKGI